MMMMISTILMTLSLTPSECGWVGRARRRSDLRKATAVAAIVWFYPKSNRPSVDFANYDEWICQKIPKSGVDKKDKSKGSHRQKRGISKNGDPPSPILNPYSEILPYFWIRDMKSVWPACPFVKLFLKLPLFLAMVSQLNLSVWGCGGSWVRWPLWPAGGGKLNLDDCNNLSKPMGPAGEF